MATERRQRDPRGKTAGNVDSCCRTGNRPVPILGFRACAPRAPTASTLVARSSAYPRLPSTIPQSPSLRTLPSIARALAVLPASKASCGSARAHSNSSSTRPLVGTEAHGLRRSPDSKAGRLPHGRGLGAQKAVVRETSNHLRCSHQIGESRSVGLEDWSTDGDSSQRKLMARHVRARRRFARKGNKDSDYWPGQIMRSRRRGPCVQDSILGSCGVVDVAA